MNQPGAASGRDAEVTAERRALVRAALACVVLVLGIYVINASSVGTEMQRSDSVRPASYPWILEGTAILAVLLSLPLALWIGHHFRFSRGRWLVPLAAHAAGALAYGSLQIGLMILFRAISWPVFFDIEFQYGDTALGLFVYEFRKQLGSYIGFQAILAMNRHLEQLRLEARAAHADARSGGRITLKCGGRTFHPSAAAFIRAKAAGNYVEACFGERDYLARMTLGELETLLHEAGTGVVRTHRSFLVNRAAITEQTPTGEGGLSLILSDGSEIPCSRSYRAGVEQATV